MPAFQGGADYAEGLAPATRRIMEMSTFWFTPTMSFAPPMRFVSADGVEQWDLRSIFGCLLQFARVPPSAKDGSATSICIGWRSTFPWDAELDAALWSRARPLLFGGKKVLVPSGEDSIVISLASVGGNSGDRGLMSVTGSRRRVWIGTE
jgi:hypothetical protein